MPPLEELDIDLEGRRARKSLFPSCGRHTGIARWQVADADVCLWFSEPYRWQLPAIPKLSEFLEGGHSSVPDFIFM